MRQRRVGATAGTVDRALAPSRRLLLRAGVVVLVAWAVIAFAQEAWTANRLAAGASALRDQNAQLQEQNDAYRRDILAVQTGSAAEEVARENGYSRPDEHLYLVSAPPAPTPTAAPPPPARVQDKSTGALDALRAWWSGLRGHGRRS
jgi:cell division protein FtsB